MSENVLRVIGRSPLVQVVLRARQEDVEADDVRVYRSPWWLSVAAALLLALALPGCGSSDEKMAATASTAPPATTEPLDVFAGYRSDIYTDPAAWLCGPMLDGDPCETGLDVTVVAPDGTPDVRPFTAPDEHRADCFYLYPGINIGFVGNVALDAPHAMEREVVNTQVGYLSRVCQVVAPFYRQATFDAADGPDPIPYLDIAYADVVDAFRHYVANDNNGRPFAIVSDSEASGLATRLIREEIDPEPRLRARLLSATIPGIPRYPEPYGDTSAIFDNVPLCAERGQTGCVITFAPYLSPPGPPPGARYGLATESRRAACVNPAALGGGDGDLDAIWPAPRPTRREVLVGGEMPPYAPNESEQPSVTTPFVSFPGLVSARCERSGDIDYLAVTVHADPADPRPDQIPSGLVEVWGLHILDLNLVVGTLADLLEDQLASIAPPEPTSG